MAGIDENQSPSAFRPGERQTETVHDEDKFERDRRKELDAPALRATLRRGGLPEPSTRTVLTAGLAWLARYWWFPAAGLMVAIVGIRGLLEESSRETVFWMCFDLAILGLATIAAVRASIGRTSGLSWQPLAVVASASTALAAAVLVRQLATSAPDPSASTGLAGAALGAIATLASITIAFTLLHMQSVVGRYSPVLAGVLLHSSTLWLFLAAATATAVTSAFELVFPPRHSLDSAAVLLSGFLALLTFGVYLASAPHELSAQGLVTRLVNSAPVDPTFDVWRRSQARRGLVEFLVAATRNDEPRSVDLALLGLARSLARQRGALLAWIRRQPWGEDPHDIRKSTASVTQWLIDEFEKLSLGVITSMRGSRLSDSELIRVAELFWVLGSCLALNMIRRDRIQFPPHVLTRWQDVMTNLFRAAGPEDAVSSGSAEILRRILIAAYDDQFLRRTDDFEAFKSARNILLACACDVWNPADAPTLVGNVAFWFDRLAEQGGRPLTEDLPVVAETRRRLADSTQHG